MNDFLLGILLFSITGVILYAGFSIWLCSIAGIKPSDLINEIMKHFFRISPIIAVLVLLKIVNINSFVKLAAAVFSVIVFYLYSIRKNQAIKEILGDNLPGFLKAKK